MKDIGSIFAVSTIDTVSEKNNNGQLDSTFKYYALCREIFLVIIKSIKARNKIVLLPAYTCSTVIHPFIQEGWTVIYFKIKKDLTIDDNDIIEKAQKYLPDIVVFHPYYGTDLRDSEEKTLSKVKQYANFIIEDATQCIYSSKKYDFVDFKVGSLRKWYPIPDGAFLDTKLNVLNYSLEENIPFLVNQIEAMYLRNIYFQTGDETIKKISIRLNKLANAEASKKIVAHRISSYSENTLNATDREICQNRRLDNYAYLDSNIIESKSIFKVLNNDRIRSAPLYFPIYVTDREKIQRELAINHIYAPILWPLYDEEMLIDEEIKYIYDHILLIPCDQRYDLNDMKLIVDLLNKIHYLK